MIVYVYLGLDNPSHNGGDGLRPGITQPKNGKSPNGDSNWVGGETNV